MAKQPSLMNLQKHLLAATAAISLGATAFAQGPVHAHGVVEFDGVGYTLREFAQRGIAVSSAIDLSEFVGEVVDVSGVLTGGPSPTFHVEEGDEAFALFEAEFAAEVDAELPGAPLVGILEMAVENPGLGEFFVFATLGSGLTPLDSFGEDVEGTWWLETSSILTLDGGFMVDLWEVAWEIPQDPALVGVQLHLQAAVKQEFSPFQFLNEQVVTLWP